MKFTKFDKDELAKDLVFHLSKLPELATLMLFVRFDVWLEKIGPSDNEDVVYVDSNELADHMYPKMFKSLSLACYRTGASWTMDENGQEVFWLPIRFHYEHFNGGRNGSECVDVYLNKDGYIVKVHSNLKERKNV